MYRKHICRATCKTKSRQIEKVRGRGSESGRDIDNMSLFKQVKQVYDRCINGGANQKRYPSRALKPIPLAWPLFMHFDGRLCRHTDEKNIYQTQCTHSSKQLESIKFQSITCLYTVRSPLHNALLKRLPPYGSRISR